MLFLIFQATLTESHLKKIRFYDAVLPDLRKDDVNRGKIFVFLYRLYEQFKV